MKRSHEPVFWALFGAGGMLSALVGPMLIFITGIALPLGWLLQPSLFSYASMLAFAQHPLGKLAVLAVISLFLFHGCHRMVHSLHDLGLQAGAGARAMSYGFAALATLATAYLLLKIGS